jgi:hypothetical protein
MAIQLTLHATESLPRVLLFNLTATGKTLSASLLAPVSRTDLSYYIGSMDTWELRPKDHMIWCRGAAIDLSDDDVARIRKAFEPHGLRIEADFPTAAPIGPESAKVAAPAVCTIPSGTRGEQPLSNCTDRGALEDVFEHFTARFLTAGESL